MILTETEAKTLIQKLQNGQTTPAEDRRLLLEIKGHYRPHKMENYLYDADELESEFLLAAWNALYRADIDRGDPIMFCVRRGNGAMLDYYRKTNSEYLIKNCPQCGRTVTYDHRNKICPVCGIEYDSNLKEEAVPVTDFDESFTSPINIENQVETSIMLEEVIEFIRNSKSLSTDAKHMAIEAIQYRIDFHTFARQEGKSSVWASRFSKRILDLIHGAEILLT